MATEKTIVQIDASSLKKSHCFLRFYRQVVQGYKTRELFNDIEYGSAWHIFRQVLAETSDPDGAVKAAQDYFNQKTIDPHFIFKKSKEFLNVAHLTLTCKTYLDKFGVSKSFGNFEPLVVNGKPLVEQTFAIPFYSNEQVDILLVGTIDEIGKLDGGCYGIGDDKTTSQWDREGFLEQHSMSGQLLFYLYAIQWLGKEYPDSIFNEMSKNRIGCFINGVFLSAKGTTEFQRSRIFFFEEERLIELEITLEYLKNRIIYASRLGGLTREGIYNDTCHGKFNLPCEFIGSCKAPTVDAREKVLSNSFIQAPYEPLMFRKYDKTK